MGWKSVTGRAIAVGVAALLPLIATGCGGTDDVTTTPGSGSGGNVTSTGPSAKPGESPEPTASGPAELTIVIDDGGGGMTTWTLTCEPPGGSHPNPAAACQVLAAKGASALPPVPPDRMCTQIFGGPERATITGTWKGTAVSARLNRTNGCEIGRWNALQGLLPPASGPGVTNG